MIGTMNLVEEVESDKQPNLSTYTMSLNKEVNRAMTSIHTKSNCYFREHYNEIYTLIPSVFRNDNWNKEDDG